MKLKFVEALKEKWSMRVDRRYTRMYQGYNHTYNSIPGMPLLTRKLRDFGKPLNEGLLVRKTYRQAAYGSVSREYKVYLDKREIGKFSVAKEGFVVGRTAIGMVKRTYKEFVPGSESTKLTIETYGFFLWDSLRILMEKAGIDPSRISESLKNTKRSLQNLVTRERKSGRASN
jgi:hypothetical protein